MDGRRNGSMPYLSRTSGTIEGKSNSNGEIYSSRMQTIMRPMVAKASEVALNSWLVFQGCNPLGKGAGWGILPIGPERRERWIRR
jgi:hypothetical protein